MDTTPVLAAAFEAAASPEKNLRDAAEVILAEVRPGERERERDYDNRRRSGRQQKESEPPRVVACCVALRNLWECLLSQHGEKQSGKKETEQCPTLLKERHTFLSLPRSLIEM